MEIKDMKMDDIQKRMAEINALLDSEDADVEALAEEVNQLESRSNEIREQAEKRSELVSKIAAGEIGKPVEARSDTVEVKTMDVKEIRNSEAYINAFANYIKTGEEKECRSLLSENATNGTVAVPEFVYDIVKNAWEKEGIMSRVKKSYLRGNLKVGFEISADGAVVHTEGGAAIDPENLVLGIVTMIPKSIKKVVQISDEVYDLRGEEFLRYIYDELAYRIAKKAADELLAAINACGTVSTTTCVGVPAITQASIALDTIAQAIANLSDVAANPVIMMNKLTYASFKAVQAAGNYGYDPFEGLPVVFNNTITAYSAATTGVTYAIVGDLGEGALANFPNGQEIEFKFDELTLKKQDLIEVFGREFVAVAPVAPNAFVKIKK